MISPLAAEYYRKKLKKTGVALTLTQLWQNLKKLKILVKKSELAQWLAKEKTSARFSASVRPKAFQTIGVLRPGVYFMDYAEFHKSWGWHNNGCTGFLLAVENVTNRLFVYPCKTKETKHWEEAIRKFIELTRNVTTIYSDRDTVVTSQNFRQRVIDRYNVNWYFLKKGSKAYLAERYIGFVKTKLSQALDSRETLTKNWVQFVEPLVSEYNKSKIEGTTYSRQAVDADNFQHFLQQRFKMQDPETLFSGFKMGPFVNEKWNLAIFKFALGQKVLLALASNWREQKKGFEKRSTKGGFGSTEYTVFGRQLRQTANKKKFVAVYALKEFGNSLHFYEAELRALNEA